MNLGVARRQMRIGGRALSYLLAGPAPAARLVVFLHAFPLDAGMWWPQLTALPPGWSGAAPDFRGFGDSDPDDPRLAPRDDARLEDYAEDVRALIDALGAPRAVLCGCSMGGYVSLAALRGYPDRVDALLLADTRATADGDAARAARMTMLERLDREGPASVATDMRTKLVGPTSRAEHPEMLAAVDRLMERATAAGIGYAVYRMLNRPDATPNLAAFCGPVAAVVGEEDTLAPPPEAASMAATAPRATLVTIPRAGHLSSLESPDPFNRALADLLGRVEAAPP